MPFDFLRRKGSGDGPTSAAGDPKGPHGESRPFRFDGMTEEWRLIGSMHLAGRLLDVINRREPIEISDVHWGPFDGSGNLESAPGLRSVDPYDLIVVMAGEGSLPILTEEQRAANRVHKVSYDVALDVSPFRVLGTVFLHPGMEPERLTDRSTEMFVPVVQATVMHGGQALADQPVDTVLVNRFYLRGVEQVDLRTGERFPKLPGAPLGGVSWQDRSR